ncbi:MAG: hypothetical protein Q8O05_04860 [Chloroflexota bacterium]|nr:hypothetical protein [Chloroflexota bacterium]
MVKRSGVLMIAEADIEELLFEWYHVPAWIKAHVSARCPPHRYAGELSLEGENLVFRGRDMKESKSCKLEIPLASVTRVAFGFSEQLKTNIDPTFGIGGPVPFAVWYRDGSQEHTLYFNTSFSKFLIDRANRNREWYETLSDVVTCRRQKPAGDRFLTTVK